MSNGFSDNGFITDCFDGERCSETVFCCCSCCCCCCCCSCSGRFCVGPLSLRSDLCPAIALSSVPHQPLCHGMPVVKNDCHKSRGWTTGFASTIVLLLMLSWLLLALLLSRLLYQQSRFAAATTKPADSGVGVVSTVVVAVAVASDLVPRFLVPLHRGEPCGVFDRHVQIGSHEPTTQIAPNQLPRLHFRARGTC